MLANWNSCFVPELQVVEAPSNFRGCYLATWAAIDGCRGWRRRWNFVMVDGMVYRVVVLVDCRDAMVEREVVVREEDLLI